MEAKLAHTEKKAHGSDVWFMVNKSFLIEQFKKTKMICKAKQFVTLFVCMHEFLFFIFFK